MMEKKKIQLIILCMMLMMIPGFKTRAAEYKEVSGTLKYDYAFEVLKLVNEERQKEGIALLTMDKSMLDSAMTRAAETSVEFSHTRPNGLMCFSINQKVYGENIAWGQSSPKDVMKSWMNSSGHRANIMNSSYKSIGIGCFKNEKGLYWVQVFGFDTAESVNCPQNTTAKYKVSLNDKIETSCVSSENDNSLSEKNEVTKNTDDVFKKEDTTNDDTNLTQDKVKGLKANSEKKKIAVSWKNDSNANGYQIQISGDKKFKKSENYISIKKSKINIRYLNGKRLKSHKKYYVRIRSIRYDDQEVILSEWSKTTVKVK